MLLAGRQLWSLTALPSQQRCWQWFHTSLSSSSSASPASPAQHPQHHLQPPGGSPLPGQDLLCNSCRCLGNAGQGPYLQRRAPLALRLPIHPRVVPQRGMPARSGTHFPPRSRVQSLTAQRIWLWAPWYCSENTLATWRSLLWFEFILMVLTGQLCTSSFFCQIRYCLPAPL